MGDDWYIETGKTVRFAKIYNYYVNVDRRILRFLKLAADNTASLGISGWNTPLISRPVRSSRVYKLCAIAARCIAVRARKVAGSRRGFACFPDLGDIAIRCFPDYVRLFDLESCIVTNLCRRNDDATRRQFKRISGLQRKLGDLGVAPKVLGSMQETNWYTEELCDGTPLHKGDHWQTQEMFDRVCAQARVIQDAGENAIGKASDVLAKLESYFDCLCVRSGKGIVDRSYYERLHDEIQKCRLSLDPAREMQGFLSHGDLSRLNILVRANGDLVFIDWQTLDYRTKDFDIYNYHFSLIKDGGTTQISEADVFKNLRSTLAVTGIGPALLRLNEFYLCFLVSRIEHFVLPSVEDADRNAKALAQLEEYARAIDRYRAYRVESHEGKNGE